MICMPKCKVSPAGCSLLPVLLSIHITFMFCPALPAQAPLYIARDFQAAIAQQTRTKTGRPGEAYWQNRAAYKIEVKVSPRNKLVEGKATVHYINRSPHTLSQLNLKIFQNVHLPGANRAEWTEDNFLTSGLFIEELKANGQKIDWRNEKVHGSEDPTNAWIDLPTPLQPGASINLEIRWHYTLQTSKSDHREGMVDDSALFCAYWYPRIGVYDDITGWDRIPANNQVEFYNDYNDYEVTVRTPPNFLVWATGELQNAAEVLAPAYLDRLREAATTDEIVPIVTNQDLRRGKITPQAGELVWKFRAENVTDFAFGVSDHFLWDAASILVDTTSGRRVNIHTAYLKSSTDFPEVARIAWECIRYFSTRMPGIPYPYPTLSIFNGHGQMEYPMMVNDNEMFSLDDTKALTAHEIAHTYFPFLVATNESAYAWMDEGWATLFEYYACTELYTLKHPEQAIYPGYYLRRYLADETPATEAPIFTPSHQLLGPAYGLNAYGKSAAAYLSLQYLLGRETFLRCLQTYAERWRGKHPSPYDFFFTFDDVSGQDLSWFWQRWFMAYNTMDLALTGYRREGEVVYIKVRNTGGKPLPIVLEVIAEDGPPRRFSFSPGLWKDTDEIELAIVNNGPVKAAELVWKDFVDVNSSNDRMEIE